MQQQQQQHVEILHAEQQHGKHADASGDTLQLCRQQDQVETEAARALLNCLHHCNCFAHEPHTQLNMHCCWVVFACKNSSMNRSTASGHQHWLRTFPAVGVSWGQQVTCSSKKRVIYG
jgi:hypothetical protein